MNGLTNRKERKVRKETFFVNPFVFSAFFVVNFLVFYRSFMR